LFTRLPFTVRLGIELIVAAVVLVGGFTWWDATRSWEPLNAPISLTRGHIRSAPFKVNVASVYNVGIEINTEGDFHGVACLVGVECDGKTAPLKVAWAISSGGRVVGSGTSDGSTGQLFGYETMGRTFGEFYAGKGLYVLRADILEDQSRFNFGKPRLVIWERGDEREKYSGIREALFFFGVILAGVGICLMVRPVLARRRAKRALLQLKTPLTGVGPQPRTLAPGSTTPIPNVDWMTFRQPTFARLGAILVMVGLGACISIYRWTGAEYADSRSLLLWLCALTAGGGGALLTIAGRDRFRQPHPAVASGASPGGISGGVRLARKPAKARPFSGLAYFGRTAAFFYMLMFLVMFYIKSADCIIPVGLTVRLMRPGVVGESTPGMQPIVVRLQRHGANSPPDLYVDSQHVSWTEFSVVLRAGLSQRPPNWPIYVEGDPEMEFKWAAMVVDTAKGLGATVVLVAPVR
jgi:hypothetical protein